MSRVALFIATACYVGFVPFAPGTAGSAVGLVVYSAVRASGPPLAEVVAIAATLVAGVWAAGVVEKPLGKDPGPVVIDEVLGMLVTLAFLHPTLVGALAGFLVFRVYDVLKPYPARRLEGLPGGPGIMLDDLMAGIYANLTLRVLIAVFPGTFA
jgi:phosphatidylglycerophosphatase A